jgi:hypothetical protein
MAHNQNSAINLARLLDKSIEVKLAGGREIQGVLKGYVPLAVSSSPTDALTRWLAGSCAAGTTSYSTWF